MCIVLKQTQNKRPCAITARLSQLANKDGVLRVTVFRFKSSFSLLAFSSR